MAVWTSNATLSLILGGLVLTVSLIPGLVWQYRRDGSMSGRRILGWCAVCLYLTALVVYTVLPLPDAPAQWCASHAVGHNLHPLAFMDDIRRETAGMAPLVALRSTVVLQVVFNVLLFVPLGVVLRRYFARGILGSTLIGFATSVLIETSQYTGLFGIYPCAYRVGDVDDVLTNTLGAFLGAVVAPALLWWMPSARALAARRLEPRPVTTGRRWMGMLVDALSFAGISFAVGVLVQVVGWLWGVEDEVATPLWTDGIPAVAAVLLVFVLPAWHNRGASLGQTAVWLTPKWVSRDGTRLEDASPLRRVLRSLVVVGPWAAAPWLVELIGNTPWGEHGPAELIRGLGVLAVVAAVVMVPFTRTHRSLSGILTGAVFVDARSPSADGPRNTTATRLTPQERDALGVKTGRG